MIDRRSFLSTGLGVAWAATGCQSADSLAHIAGGWTGVQAARGHWLRDGLQGGRAWPAPAKIFKTRVVIAGGGVAGLAAARLDSGDEDMTPAAVRGSHHLHRGLVVMTRPAAPSTGTRSRRESGTRSPAPEFVDGLPGAITRAGGAGRRGHAGGGLGCGGPRHHGPGAGL